jgi:hypothetical protein
MSTATVTRPASPAGVVALQYAVPTRMVTIPLGILGAVVVVMAVVTATVVGGGGSAKDLAYNGAVVWSLVGYIVAIGVQSVSVTFPLALALGTTRRTFTLGTLASAVAESVLLAAASLLLLGLERLTGGWFVGARVLSDPTLGNGNPLLLVAEVLLGSLTALSVGGLYGTAFVRFGAKGPGAIGLGTALLAVLALLLLLGPIVAVVQALGVWALVLTAVVLIVVSTLGEYLLLRRASVR